MFKIATWNVNSLRVRLPQVLDWLAKHQPDVLALQETKMKDEDFPLAEIQAAGYQCVYSGQKTYNGMAVLSKKTCQDVIVDIPELSDPQRRILGVSVDDLRILNMYVPNGESIISPKYDYKLNWLKHFELYLKEQLLQHSKLVILGDFNIAPEEADVHDPAEWAGRVLFSEPERSAFKSFIELELSDCFRLHERAQGHYSWWDYRMNAFKRNRGVRIDHILASKALTPACTHCYIDKLPRGWDRPSDHTPVVAEFNI